MTRIRTLVAGVCLAVSALAAPACAADGYTHNSAHRVYHESRDAVADVEAALERARVGGRRALLVFGANWCHDSRGLAGHLERPGIAEFVAANFEVVFIDVGVRERNLGLAAIFGQPRITGTPTLVVVDPDGTRVNGVDDATAWRNSDSRSPEDVLAALRGYLPERAP